MNWSPPNKRYDLMDANKKVGLDHMQCPPESKILTNIIKNHPLRFSIAASSSVPWIYMAQFWHTLKEDISKYRLKFMLDKKELNLTLDDFRTIFHLPQATDNNHNSFVPPPSFSEMMVQYEAFACRCGAEDVVLRDRINLKPVVNYTMHVHGQSLGKITLDVNFLWKEERVRLLVSSPEASLSLSYSPGPSTPQSYSSGPSTPQSYSP
ncbi:hypothetical protein Tco_0595903 [Tanacetum coccineum]